MFTILLLLLKPLKVNFNNENEDYISTIFVAERVALDSQIPAVKFLGVFFDPQLNFNYHVKHITSKLSKALYMLRCTKHFLPPKARKAVYYTLFHCHLIYCLPIWSCTSLSNLNTITTLQKKAVRIVAAENFNAHTEPIFKKLKILPLQKLTLYFNLQIMQKFKQGFLPTSFNQTWSDNRVRRGDQFKISLRNENLFNIPFARLTSSLKLPLVNLPRTWEDFKNENVKIIRNKIEFNHKLKEHLLDELSEVISCNRLFCPACLQHA